MSSDGIRTTNLGDMDVVDTPWGEVRRQDAWFFSDGKRIAAELFWPVDSETTGSLPGLVMCQGFGGLKKMNVDNFAKYFARSGYVSLIFDYRGFGESEGERWRLEPNEQVEDIQAAITFLTAVEGVDESRLGVYGTSFGGGNVIAAAGGDARIRCVVSSVGFGDGYRWIRSLRRSWEWIEFTKRLERDRLLRVLTGESEQIEPEEIMVRDPESIDNERELRSRVPDRAFKLRLRDGDFILGFSPELYAPRISPRPVMLIGVKDDGLISNDETYSLYEKLGEPKKLVWMGAIGHHAVYHGEHLEEVLRNALGWYEEHLK